MSLPNRFHPSYLIGICAISIAILITAVVTAAAGFTVISRITTKTKLAHIDGESDPTQREVLSKETQSKLALRDPDLVVSKVTKDNGYYKVEYCNNGGVGSGEW